MKNYHTKDTMQIKSVTLIVKDIVRSLTFYTKQLGLTLLNQKDHLYTLGTENKVPLIHLIEQQDAREKTRSTGLYHFALLLPHRSYLGQVIHHFITTKQAITGGADHGISEALYLNDPDGNGIEIYADKPKSAWPDFNNVVNQPLDYQNLIDTRVNTPFIKLPKETIMGHLHLHVSNIHQGDQFFIDTLGFDSTMAYGPHARFVSNQGYHHHIGYNVWNGLGVNNRAQDEVGLYAYELYLPNKLFDAQIEHLKTNGYPVLIENEVYSTKDMNDVIVTLVRGE